MALVTGYGRSGKKQEAFSIHLEPLDRVVFVDNSFINDCYLNNQWAFYAGSGDGLPAKNGTVVRTNSVQTAFWEMNQFEIDMPIVVQVDESGDIVYCNPLNIRKV